MSVARFISKSIKASKPNLGTFIMQNRLFTTAALTPQQMLAASCIKLQESSKKADELQQKSNKISSELSAAQLTVDRLKKEYSEAQKQINNASEYPCDELIPMFAKKIEEAGSKEFYEELKITSVIGTPYYLTLTLETKKPCMMNNFMTEHGIIPDLVGSIERDKAESGMIIQKITLKKEYYRFVLEGLTGVSLDPELEKKSPAPSANL